MLKRFLSGLVMFLSALCVFALPAISAQTATVKSDVPHWTKNPVRVYIPKNDTYAVTLRNAFARWQNASSGKIRFVYIEKGPGDIDVIFDETANGDTPISSHSINSNGNSITKAELRFATKGKDIKKYSKNYIYTAMLHEVGHVLGLSHADRKKTSIMYPEIHTEQQIMKLDIRKLYYVNGWSWMDRRF